MEARIETAQPQTENDNLKSTITKLRIVSPLRMRRIDVIRKERKELLETLSLDEQEHFLGANRFHRIMDYRRTEGLIVQEMMDGLTGGNLIARRLWGKALVEVGKTVNVGRRTQIYADLEDSYKAMLPINPTRKLIERVLKEFENYDPEIKKRANDEDFFRSQILEVESTAINDTLGGLFT